MRSLIPVIILCALVAACSEEKPKAPSGKALVQTDPLAEVQEELARNPRNADAWFHLADLYERNGMYAEEADALKKVVSIEPGRGYAYLKLGTAYNRLEKFTDAIAQFQKAKKYQPKNPVLFNNLAFSYGKTGKTDEQIAALKRAITLRPNYATARYNLGMVYLKQKRKDEALKQYDALRSFDEGMAKSLKKEIDARRK